MTDTKRTYQDVREGMRSGDSIIWSGTGPVARLIQWRTGSKWNHVSTVVRLTDMGIDRVFVTEAVATGVVFFPLSRRIREHRGALSWLQLHRDYEDNRDGVRRWAMRKVGRPYDFESIFAQVFRRVSPNARALFCSEFSFLALRDGGGLLDLQVFDVAPWPSDLVDLGIFEPGCPIDGGE